MRRRNEGQRADSGSAVRPDGGLVFPVAGSARHPLTPRHNNAALDKLKETDRAVTEP
jgi:hypothetical protein